MVAVLLAALPSVAQNLALNPGFESGTTSWFSTGPATLTSPTAQSHSGSRSGVLANRADAWNGIHQSVLGVLQPTNTYKISAWVRLVGGGNQPVLLTMQKTDGGGDDLHNRCFRHGDRDELNATQRRLHAQHLGHVDLAKSSHGGTARRREFLRG